MALDADGSTLGLVNAANPNSAPVTTYTYDPSGTPTVSGTANDWPFLFDGSEHELTDPASLYYEGSGNYYDPLIMRELAQVDATGLGQPNLGGSSGGGSKGTGGASRRGTGEASGPAHAEFQIHIGGSNSESTNIDSTTLTTIVEYVALAAATFGLYELFDDLFGGGGSSLEIPRQMIHGRHPLYPVILGITDGEIPTMESSGGPQFCGDPAPCPNARPLHRAEDAYQSPNSGQYYQGLHEIPPFAVCMGLVGGFNAESIISCVGQSINCGSTLFGNPEGPAGCVEALGPCAVTGAIIAGCYGVSRNIKQPAPPEGLQ
jgi:hypothetical protein